MNSSADRRPAFRFHASQVENKAKAYDLHDELSRLWAAQVPPNGEYILGALSTQRKNHIVLAVVEKMDTNINIRLEKVLGDYPKPSISQRALLLGLMDPPPFMNGQFSAVFINGSNVYTWANEQAIPISRHQLETSDPMIIAGDLSRPHSISPGVYVAYDPLTTSFIQPGGFVLN